MNESIAIHWFRRDLRLDDNASLYHALKNHERVLPIFIFDKHILDDLEDKSDARVSFIYTCLQNIWQQLKKYNSTLLVLYGYPEDIWKTLIETHSIEAVYANHDYEPYAIKRDADIKTLLAQKNIPFCTYKDQVIFEKNEIVKDDNTPYTVFTPYSKKWKLKKNNFSFKPYPTQKYFNHFLKIKAEEIIPLQTIGFALSTIVSATPQLNENIIVHYDTTRDFPGIEGTSKMSIHLRFGTISIRKLAARADQLNQKYFNELLWREFYQMIIWHFPHVVHRAFKPQYDAIQWRNNEKEFDLWCKGQTGYPIVDAGMRELNTTGYMHNRVRMIVASFLTKDLLIDWRWGEAYFAKKLMDFELASNNGGWQWAAGTGVDAAPYFRIFNPTEQTKKFDPELSYIKKWVPEFNQLSYMQPIVDHAAARNRTLKAYKVALQ